MSNDKTGFALVPKKKEPTKILGIEARTLLAVGALGLGTYLIMTHDPLEKEDEELDPKKGEKEPDWWREARENDSIGTRAARGTRRVGAVESEIDREYEAEADAVEEDERRAMESEDEDEEEIDEEDDEEFEI